MAAIFISGVRKEWQGLEEIKLKVTADDETPICLGFRDSVQITAKDEIGIMVVCFEKGDPPVMGWFDSDKEGNVTFFDRLREEFWDARKK